MLDLPIDYKNFKINEDYLLNLNYLDTEYNLQFLCGLSGNNYLIINGYFGLEGNDFFVNGLKFNFTIVDDKFLLKINDEEAFLSDD